MTSFAMPLGLADMLQCRRPAGTKSEKEFVRRFIDPVGVETDGYGNRIKRIGNAPVLWSCHTDTVHTRGGKQKLKMTAGEISLAPGGDSNCLGADDTAGVWLMLEMIRSNVEGLYIFHRAEEIGGLGSDWIARKEPHLLQGITMAIALDRRGNDSVITHQGARCCSDNFATALAGEIGLGLRPDPTGLFTDTANYTEIIPECTNISVGYDHAHSSKECLDVDFLMALRARLLNLDVSSLPISRDPADIEYDWGTDQSDRWQDHVPYAARRFDVSQDIAIEETCKRYPRAVRRLLLDYGISEDDLMEYVFQEYGVLP